MLSLNYTNKAIRLQSSIPFHRFTPPYWNVSRARSEKRGLFLWMAMIVLGIAVGPGKAIAQRALGIDVSSYQGSSINWSSVNGSGVTFAWAKATEGTYYIDADFAINEANAKAAGVMIGAYDFANYNVDTGTAGATAEANYFWSTAKNYVKGGGSYLVPMLDVELAPTGYTRASLSQWVNQWCNTVTSDAAAAGLTVKPVVYTYYPFATTWLDSSVTQWPLWMATPNGSGLNPQTGAPGSTSPWSNWNLWQYSQGGSVSGVSGLVDQDVFNGTTANLESTLGVVNAPEPATWSLILLGLGVYGVGRRCLGRRQ